MITFEGLVNCGLSIGLTYTDILNMKIGLLLGLINDKNNQYDKAMKESKKNSKGKNKNNNEEIIKGNANMLMNM